MALVIIWCTVSFASSLPSPQVPIKSSHVKPRQEKSEKVDRRRPEPSGAVVAPKFRAASLFTGIGGFDLGFERAGFEITFQCELDQFCRSILQHHWPKIECHENIKELASSAVPFSDVWAGGFPCHIFSPERISSQTKRRNGNAVSSCEVVARRQYFDCASNN